jgi:hypothetical protein
MSCVAKVIALMPVNISVARVPATPHMFFWLSSLGRELLGDDRRRECVPRNVLSINPPLIAMLPLWRTRPAIRKCPAWDQALTVIGDCAATMDEVRSVQIRHAEPQLSRAWWSSTQGEGWRLGIETCFRPCPRYINREARGLRVRVAAADQHQEQDHHEDASWYHPSDRIIGSSEPPELSWVPADSAPVFLYHGALERAGNHIVPSL